MSKNRKYIVSYEAQGYLDNHPYRVIEELAKHDNIAETKEITTMIFYVACGKHSEDELIKDLRADQILYSDDGDNYFKELK